jgi:hypothetical protein
VLPGRPPASLRSPSWAYATCPPLADGRRCGGRAGAAASSGHFKFSRAPKAARAAAERRGADGPARAGLKGGAAASYGSFCRGSKAAAEGGGAERPGPRKGKDEKRAGALCRDR